MGEIKRGMNRRTPNTHIPQTIHPREPIHRRALLRCSILFPELPQPHELEELLGEEERADEVWLGRECCEVTVVYVHHVWAAEYAVLLRGEVEEEGCGREVVHGGGLIAHDERVDVVFVSV